MAVLCPVEGTPAMPPAASARVFAAALVEMMRWWLNRGACPAAQEMDAHFHGIVRDGLPLVVPQPIQPE